MLKVLKETIKAGNYEGTSTCTFLVHISDERKKGYDTDLGCVQVKRSVNKSCYDVCMYVNPVDSEAMVKDFEREIDFSFTELEYEAIYAISAEVFKNDSYEFTHMSVEAFNEKYNVNYTEEFDIETFTDYIESEEVSYNYASYNFEDVLKASNEFEAETGHICTLICVNWLYLSII